MTAAPPRSPGLGLTAAGLQALRLTCKVTWDDIGADQYCEFRCAPSGVWASGQFSADVVRQMQKEQFGKYLQTWRDIVEMKEDCGATARTLAERGPPMWLHDAGGFPLPEGQTHVDRLWFMADRGGRSAPVSAALDGAALDPSSRARLAELHRQIYAYFSQDGSGTAPLPECPPELLSAEPGASSEPVRSHVQWLCEKFEPMRGGGSRQIVAPGAAAGKKKKKKKKKQTQKKQQQKQQQKKTKAVAVAQKSMETSPIGSKIPAKYHHTAEQGRTGSDDGAAANLPTAAPRVSPVVRNPAVRPAPRRPPVSSAVKVVHAVLYLSAMVTSAASVALLYGVLRGNSAGAVLRALWQRAVHPGQAPFPVAPSPAVEDFLSRVPQWALVAAQSRPVAAVGAAGVSSAARGLQPAAWLWRGWANSFRRRSCN